MPSSDITAGGRSPVRGDVRAAFVVSVLSIVWTVLTGSAAVALGVTSGSVVLIAFGAVGGLDALGSAALAEVDEHVPRHDAVAAHLHEKNGDLERAARLYAVAARNAPNLAEREHQTRQAARLNHLLRPL